MSTQEETHTLNTNEPAMNRETLHTLQARRLTAIAGALVIGVLYFALPAHLQIIPGWIPFAVEFALMLPLIISSLMNKKLPHITVRILTITLLGFVTVMLATGIALLIITLPGNKHAQTLLQSAALLWVTNILVFALWYWEVDGGGPLKRHLSGHKATDFMFPQQTDGNKTGWAPVFFDYLFVAFTGATALSPADTYPLTPRAKMLMMLEGMLSLVIIVLLAARAVNILG